ncbi:interleukin-8 [Xenopus laevis]|uniref:Interleukin-8 n=2 Tax=Xenopus laevis TaxID=8355 RepID=A0A1L8HMG0_XENLA|nr:interleukin-8 [Xenopus laevis]OCT97279.1 hypothetical protein XELAEV_18009504mg [Xenopus laevis]
MSTKIIVASLALCLLYTTLTQAMTLSGTGLKPNCQCLETVSTFIHPRFRQNVELNYECESVEVIINLTTETRVCVDPSAKWVKRMIQNISE